MKNLANKYHQMEKNSQQLFRMEITQHDSTSSKIDKYECDKMGMREKMIIFNKIK